MKKPVSPQEAGFRTCLKCNKHFKSKSAANRICGKCKKINDKIPITEAQLALERGCKRHNGLPLELEENLEYSDSIARP